MASRLHADWLEFLSLLTLHRVKYLMVGGHAVSVYAAPRLTEDLDVFVEASRENARRLHRVFADFGFASAAPEEAVLAQRGRVFMLGVKPYRIDVLTSISGVRFQAAWSARTRVQLGGLRILMISREHLIKNKRASGRLKDLVDVETLLASPRARTTHKKRR
jgi:hypothetical protein